VYDHHTHLVGLGVGGTGTKSPFRSFCQYEDDELIFGGCKVHSNMNSWLHPFEQIKKQFFLSAAGDLGFITGSVQEQNADLVRCDGREESG
jgi:hypothetical protein